jgi:hypothetical protein
MNRENVDDEGGIVRWSEGVRERWSDGEIE